MPRFVEIEFLGTGVVGRAELFDDAAPLTCQAVWDALPASGQAIHAIYSGTVAALLLDDTSVGAGIGEENATSLLATGDLVFTHYDPGKRHGHAFAVSEIYWAYDRYARPTIPGQFVPAVANVFGRIVGTFEQTRAFYDLSRRLHSEGFKPLEIRRSA
jgi:hypothetical protein